MNFLQAEHLTKAYGEKVLFEDISFGIERGQKVALIARNGTGKSTLMRILAGLDVADSGKVTLRNGLRIAFLDQNPPFRDDITVLDAIFSSDNDAMRALRDYEYSLTRMKSHPGAESDKLVSDSMLKMDASGGWDYETRAREILGQFAIHDLTQSISELSGGQKKKIALAHTLIGEPDLLLLDEPTNHLDFEMIEWLEEYLSRESLSLLLVTHDRYFLDNVCDTILELESSAIYPYRGNYSYYLEKKAEREFQEEQSLEKARNIYKTELDWIRRMPKARTTKSKSRIDAFSEVKEKATQRKDDKTIQFGVNANPLGGKIIEVDNITKRFGDFIAIDDFSYIFKRGEKIGVVGLNGAGKSTLLNIISGRLRPDLGKITVGQTVVMGYYTQEGLQPIEDKRVIDIVKGVAEEIQLKKGSMSASQFLNHFNFSYPVQQAYFSSLSGGEKRRLYLLLQLIKNPNFLILDEPTNDLDIQTLQVLEEFLADFPGCLLIVSHDRFLLDKLCDHVFVFEGYGKIKDFYGNYTKYYQWRVNELKRIKLKKEAEEKPLKPEPEKKSSGKPSYKQLKEFEQLEKDIQSLEAEKETLLSRLNSGQAAVEELNKLSVRYSELESMIEEKTMLWMELGEIIDSSKK
ncbi:MAG: ABC-F family ATP-binding cassette domain-containing protein [Bacteroidetes bacterium]|nr:ABC-F family ATP-binding cassette domain-containing protein [Bacteroidota bacterium]